MELLFSYGTLQHPKVQLENYGRRLEGTAEEVNGYRLQQLQITDAAVLAKSQQNVHPIAVKSKDNNARISGMCFKITAAELAATDHYEVQEYIRVQEYTLSGKKVWIYVANSDVQLGLLGK